MADRHSLDLAAVYHALAYYHEHPAELRRVAREGDQTIENHRDRALTAPGDVE